MVLMRMTTFNELVTLEKDTCGKCGGVYALNKAFTDPPALTAAATTAHTAKRAGAGMRATLTGCGSNSKLASANYVRPSAKPSESNNCSTLNSKHARRQKRNCGA